MKYILVLLWIWSTVLCNGYEGIRCYCNECKDTNYTCVTNGLCYAQALREDDGTLKYLYKCLDRSKFFPPSNPFVCRENLPEYNNFHCCYTDLCNEGIRPPPPGPNAKSVTELNTSDDEKDQCSLPPDTETCETGKKKLYFYYRASTNSCTPFLDGNCKKYNNKFKNGPKCMEICGGIGHENRWLLDLVSADFFREMDDEVVQWDINQIKDIIGGGYIDTPTFRLAEHNWFLRMFHLYSLTCIYLEKVTNETKHSVTVSLSIKSETNVFDERVREMQKEHEGLFRVSACMYTSALDSLKANSANTTLKASHEPKENLITVSCSIRLNRAQEESGENKTTKTDLNIGRKNTERPIEEVTVTESEHGTVPDTTSDYSRETIPTGRDEAFNDVIPDINFYELGEKYEKYKEMFEKREKVRYNIEMDTDKVYELPAISTTTEMQTPPAISTTTEIKTTPAIRSTTEIKTTPAISTTTEIKTSFEQTSSTTEHTVYAPIEEQDICSQPPDTETCKDQVDVTAKQTYYYYRATTKTCAMFLYGGCNKYNRFKDLEDCVATCGGPHKGLDYLYDTLGAVYFKELSDNLVTWKIEDLKDLKGDWILIDTPTFSLAGHNWFIRLAHMYKVSCVYLEKVTKETKNSVSVLLSIKYGTTLLKETRNELPEDQEGLFRVVACMSRSDLNTTTVEPVTVSCSMRSP